MIVGLVPPMIAAFMADEVLFEVPLKCLVVPLLSRSIHDPLSMPKRIAYSLRFDDISPSQGSDFHSRMHGSNGGKIRVPAYQNAGARRYTLSATRAGEAAL